MDISEVRDVERNVIETVICVAAEIQSHSAVSSQAINSLLLGVRRPVATPLVRWPALNRQVDVALKGGRMEATHLHRLPDPHLSSHNPDKGAEQCRRPVIILK